MCSENDFILRCDNCDNDLYMCLAIGMNIKRIKKIEKFDVNE